MHPDHDLSLGEAYYKDIYEALRASPSWNETLLVITFDEHGGFYDRASARAARNALGVVSARLTNGVGGVGLAQTCQRRWRVFPRLTIRRAFRISRSTGTGEAHEDAPSTD
jgi:phospholipase C